MENNVREFLLDVTEEELKKLKILETYKNSLEDTGTAARLIELMKIKSINKICFEKNDDKWSLDVDYKFINTLSGHNTLKNLDNDVFKNVNELINPFYCDVKVFLKELEKEVKEKNILQGPKNELNNNSVTPLLALMFDKKVKCLYYREGKNVKWYLNDNNEYINEFENIKIPQKTFQGEPFKATNEFINPFFIKTTVVQPPIVVKQPFGPKKFDEIEPGTFNEEEDIFVILQQNKPSILSRKGIINTVRNLLNGSSIGPIKNFMREKGIKKLYHIYEDGKKWELFTENWQEYYYINEKDGVRSERPANSGEVFNRTNDYMNPHSGFYRG